MGSLDKAGPSLHLSFSPSVPRDLLITLESECSLALGHRTGKRERAKHRVCVSAQRCAAQPPGTSQRRPASTGCDIYRASGSLLFFRGNRLPPWEINRRFLSFLFPIPSSRRAEARGGGISISPPICDRTVGVTMAAAFVSGHCQYLAVKPAA